MAVTVLLADRRALMREGLRAILSVDRDMEVLGEADSGQAAVRICLARVPDVLVIDAGMDDPDSAEATRRILQQHPGIRVLAIGRNGDRVLEMLRAGAAGYVLKANVYPELRRAIGALRRGQSYFCPASAQSIAEAIRNSGHLGRRAKATPRLGARERQVLQLLAQGLSAPQVAETLQIASTTAETHRRNIMRKLDVHNVVELTRYAIRAGLTSVDG